ncbi:MAG: DUF1571 domain-containing protein [Planctomycetes bacterium]|nr:DUF1571 domain-containing protein [Planctomycetota bacterium]
MKNQIQYKRHKRFILTVASLAILMATAIGVNAAEISHSEFLTYARTDYPKLLEAMIIGYDSRVTDYTGTLSKQERVNGKLRKPQTTNFKFRNRPFSIFMQWTKNPGKIDRLLFVKGQNKNKMVVHPTGIASFIKSLERPPACKEVFKANLRSCDKFGIRNMLQRLQTNSKTAQLIYLGETKVDNRNCITIETIVPMADKPNEFTRMTIKVDLVHRLPVSVTSRDKNGNLLSTYTYTNLKFNTNLTDADFTKKANKL